MLIIPVLCISSAILLGFIQRFVGKYYHLLSYSIVGAIVIFGIVSTTLLITLDVNSDYYKIYAAVVEKIPDKAEQQDGKITLIGSHWWVWDTYWIAQYILDKPYYWIDPHLDSKFKDKILTEKVLIVGDPIFVNSLSRRTDSDNLRQIRSLYNESSVLATFNDNVTSQTKEMSHLKVIIKQNHILKFPLKVKFYILLIFFCCLLFFVCCLLLPQKIIPSRNS